MGLKKYMEELKVTNLVKFYTLLLLNQGPKHGYELMKNLEQLFGKEISASQVYPFLSKLEKQGLIIHKKIESRDKKKYSITSKGKAFTHELLQRFDTILDSLVESKIKKCAHCECEIYKHGFEKIIKGKKVTFCCEHCAKAKRT